MHVANLGQRLLKHIAPTGGYEIGEIWGRKVTSQEKHLAAAKTADLPYVRAHRHPEFGAHLLALSMLTEGAAGTFYWPASQERDEPRELKLDESLVITSEGRHSEPLPRTLVRCLLLVSLKPTSR